MTGVLLGILGLSHLSHEEENVGNLLVMSDVPIFLGLLLRLVLAVLGRCIQLLSCK